MGEWRGWRAAAQERAVRRTTGSTVGPRGPPGTSVRPCTPRRSSPVPWHGCCCRVDEALGRPASLGFVDMGAGRGELVTGVLAALPAEVAARARGYAVELADRPAGLDHRVEWLTEPPGGVTGLLFANEWLDNVPVEVAEVDPTGVPRLVLVRRDGTERLGEPVAGADARWLARWWPLPPEPGRGPRSGCPRDTAWAAAAATSTGGSPSPSTTRTPPAPGRPSGRSPASGPDARRRPCRTARAT